MVDRIPIKLVRKMITCKASCVHEEASLLNVARIMVKDPKTRAVYVINREGKLQGIISLMTLIEHVFHEYSPKLITRLFGASWLLDLIEAKKASDIMGAPVYVKDIDTLKTAIRLMIENQLKELPVVDDNLRVIGDLNMLEIVSVWITKQEHE